MQQIVRPEKADGVKATYQDWLALPETPRYELIEGELCMAAAPLLPHFWVIEFIYAQLILRDFKRQQGTYGRDGAAVRLDLSNNTYIPDLFFFAKENSPIIEEADFFGVPDFVLEVWNKDYKKRERNKKLSVYQRLGVKEYWDIFTEEKRVSVRRFPDYTPVDYTEGSGVVLSSTTLIDYELDIDEMFAFVESSMRRNTFQG